MTWAMPHYQFPISVLQAEGQGQEAEARGQVRRGQEAEEYLTSAPAPPRLGQVPD